MLAEATITQFSKERRPETFQENLEVARAGGTVAGHARAEIDAQSSTPVITAQNATQLNQVVTDMIEGMVTELPKATTDKPDRKE